MTRQEAARILCEVSAAATWRYTTEVRQAAYIAACHLEQPEPAQHSGTTITDLQQMVNDRLTLDAAGLPIDTRTPVCAYCNESISIENGAWVDNTHGDCCSGDDACRNENRQHTPVRHD